MEKSFRYLRNNVSSLEKLDKLRDYYDSGNKLYDDQETIFMDPEKCKQYLNEIDAWFQTIKPIDSDFETDSDDIELENSEALTNALEKLDQLKEKFKARYESLLKLEENYSNEAKRKTESQGHTSTKSNTFPINPIRKAVSWPVWRLRFTYY